MNLSNTIRLFCEGTSEGAKKGWEGRERAQSESPVTTGKTLRQFLPPHEYNQASNPKVEKLLEAPVVKEHKSWRDGDRWPGPQKHVEVWWELANGYAVGWNENPSTGQTFPIVKLPKKEGIEADVAGTPAPNQFEPILKTYPPSLKKPSKAPLDEELDNLREKMPSKERERRKFDLNRQGKAGGIQVF